jgi:hypothetical protein
MGVQVITGKAAVPARQDGRWAISFPALAGKAVRANFLIVATGRIPLLPGKRARILLPLLALYAHWKPSPSIQPQIAIEALRDGWVWRAPLADGNCCAVAFADPVLRSQSKHRDIQSDYLNLVSQAGILADCLNGCRSGRVSACDASGVAAEEVIGRDWMLVGDSAVALEPISAQGIQVALKMGFQGAIVAHTLISNAGSAPIAETFYRDQCRAIATRHAHVAGEFYARPLRFQDEPFWKSRASRNNKFALEAARSAPVEMATKLRLSANARLHDVPCLIGERIRMHPALNHTGLDGPVSHLGEIAVAALLNPITEAKTIEEICRLWTQMELTQRPLPLVHWFLKNGVLMPIDATK